VLIWMLCLFSLFLNVLEIDGNDGWFVFLCLRRLFGCRIMRCCDCDVAVWLRVAGIDAFVCDCVTIVECVWFVSLVVSV
jgi:uncharacterized membrane protein YecN with MAPEG domain